MPTTTTQAYALWIKLPHKTVIAEDDNQILGTYYIKVIVI